MGNESKAIVAGLKLVGLNESQAKRIAELESKVRQYHRVECANVSTLERQAEEMRGAGEEAKRILQRFTELLTQRDEHYQEIDPLRIANAELKGENASLRADAAALHETLGEAP